jgi:hypothetical protein
LPWVVPDMTSRILRGEPPEIQEVTTDPFRGWLQPEYGSLDEARRVISNLAWVLIRAYPQNPNKAKMVPLSLGY